MPSRSPSTRFDVRVRAFAKINRSLRVLGATPDGYHELRTVFQSIALHDTLAFRRTRAAFQIECRAASCPGDESNLVWKAAAAVWRAAGRGGPPRGLTVRLTKRIPLQAGLGGGSSDAAAALRACAALWRVRLGPSALEALARSLGADVPFFLSGGTMLGTGRGDRLAPLPDEEAAWVVLVLPPFGVSTAEAFAWWDAEPTRGAGEAANDLQAVVAARHPIIQRIATRLRRSGASEALMTGSGSTVFGLFPGRGAADRAARAVPPGWGRTLVTRTVNRVKYQTLAAVEAHRID
jgi:4-diphosphocytidyl-2-C-methyl-D-erythritol kinase